MCLKAPVNDPLSGARFAAGPQTISGAAALAFVRQRHGLPEGDLSRIRRQQVFLAAVADKVLVQRHPDRPDQARRALIDVLQSALVIDAGWDLLAFARQASDIAAGNLRFLTIPTRGPETNDARRRRAGRRGRRAGLRRPAIAEQAGGRRGRRRTRRSRRPR